MSPLKFSGMSTAKAYDLFTAMIQIKANVLICDHLIIRLEVTYVNFISFVIIIIIIIIIVIIIIIIIIIRQK